MGGGGEDFGAQTAASEAKKQAARDALNLQFGVANSGAAAPDRNSFVSYVNGAPVVTSSGGDGGGDQTYVPQVEQFDQAGYDSALAAYNSRDAEAAKNKAAREALYTGVRDDTYKAGLRGLDETKEAAARNTDFALFGQGLNGGSEDVNQHALLDRTYNQGKLNLGAKADAAAADLRGNDESTRLGLLQSIDSGLDQGSALSSSLNSLKVNSDSAAAAAQGTSLGDLFSDAGLLYSKSKAGQGVQDARTTWNAQYPSTSSGSRKGAASGLFSSTG